MTTDAEQDDLMNKSRIRCLTLIYIYTLGFTAAHRKPKELQDILSYLRGLYSVLLRACLEGFFSSRC